MPRNTLTPVTPEVKLTEDEQEHLFAIIHKGQHSARVITRARIVSKLIKGHSNQEVCSAVEVTLPTVLKTRKRLAEGGLEAALSELPRPGAAPKLDAKQAAMVTAIACSMAVTIGPCDCWVPRSWNSASPPPIAMKACASCSKKQSFQVTHHPIRRQFSDHSETCILIRDCYIECPLEANPFKL